MWHHFFLYQFVLWYLVCRVHLIHVLTFMQHLGHLVCSLSEYFDAWLARIPLGCQYICGAIIVRVVHKSVPIFFVTTNSDAILTLENCLFCVFVFLFVFLSSAFKSLSYHKQHRQTNWISLISTKALTEEPDYTEMWLWLHYLLPWNMTQFFGYTNKFIYTFLVCQVNFIHVLCLYIARCIWRAHNMNALVPNLHVMV